MKILGVNAYHADSSAALVIDGQLKAAVAEERFNRLKHWGGLPLESIKYCLATAGVSLSDIDYIAVNRNPKANLCRKLLWASTHRLSRRTVKDRTANLRKILTIKEDIVRSLGDFTDELESRSNTQDKFDNIQERFRFRKDSAKMKLKIHFVEHHLAHAASAFFVSPFDQAAILSIDGFGDFVSTLLAKGQGSRIQTFKRIYFPHSLGILYLMVTQYLGFWKYGDEYKVMGLAAYGQPVYLDKFRKIIRKKSDGTFSLDLSYCLHHSQGVVASWFNEQPTVTQIFSQKFIDEFGPPREPNGPMTEHYENIAASLQAVTEEIYFYLLNHLYQQTRLPNLCLAGGVALNSSVNGKIFERTPFKEVFIQPAASDDGGAVGAAFYLWHQILGRSRSFQLTHAYWGPAYEDAQIEQILKNLKVQYQRLEDEDLMPKVAQAIADGKIVGWFQGRLEFGPRALGNRSILVDPRRVDMKDILNERIKRRESFRPFAPSILADRVGEWFELSYPEPFMIKTYRWRAEKQSLVPAVVHKDGTGRLQTVDSATNPRYYRLIQAFEQLTGIPLVLNTSFNENEPIVNRPEEAIDCFNRTKMDVLVLGNFYIEKQ